MRRIEELLASHAPEGVPMLSLGEVGTWYGGGTPSKSVAEFWDNGTVPWLSPKDMDADVIRETGMSVSPSALSKSPLKLVPKGSIAFVVRSNVLRRRLPIALVPFETTLNQDMRAVVPHEGVLGEYVMQACRSRADDILAIAGRTDGSMAAISTSLLLQYRIPIPPLPVQEEVVRVVGKLATLQTDLERSLEAELAARQRQFEYYRASLLSFDTDLSLSLGDPSDTRG